MPKISEEQRQARRDQILAAAWRCFLRRGIQGTSMEEIIREAKLSAGAVYLYYEGKDDLIFAAIATYMGELRHLLVPILMRESALAPVELVGEITTAISKHTQRTGMDLNAVILMCWGEAQSNAKLKELIAEFQLKYREALANIASQWQERGELPMGARAIDIAKAMHSFFLGFIVQSALLGRVDPVTAARGIAGLIGGKANPRSRRASKIRAK
jgi:AcrR family transcriptional regulator